MGNLMAVLVLAAGVSDRDGGELLLALYHELYPLLEIIWADGSYAGELATDLQAWYGITLVIVSQLAEQKGFAVLPRRWIVERTFAWLTQSRRLVRDYERDPASSEAGVWIAAIHRTVKYLAPTLSAHVPYQRRNTA
jgi:transposase